MSHLPFGAHPVLDFGLRVRVEIRPAQRAIFSAAPGLSAEALTAELAEMVSSLRVHSYSLRAQLEEITSALQANVQCGWWVFARRAALDLASLLAQAHRHRLVKGPLALRGAKCALRIAELVSREAC